MTKAILIIDEKDNVAVALRDLATGENVAAGGRTPVPVIEPIPAAHKIALRNIEPGEKIIKYGEPIGRSIQSIQQGAWVHTHNIEGGQ